MKNFEFKNIGDLREKRFTEYPEDIIVNGKSIFEQEKTSAQIEAIKTAIRLVDNHCKDLGVEKKSYDINRVVFFPHKRKEIIGGEYLNADLALLDEINEANLHTNIHELIHAYSSEWTVYEHAELEKWVQDTPRNIKTGFSTVWTKGTKGKGPIHQSVNFRALNEGITDKITRGIIENNPQELQNLKPLFQGREQQKKKEEEDAFKVELSRVEYERNDILQKIEDLEKKKRNNQEFNEIELEGFRSSLNGISKKIESIEKWHAQELESIQKAYSFNPDHQKAYNFEVQVVENIIEGLARSSEFKTLSPIEAKKAAWQELQRAYFAGKTVFLRKLEKVFGDGFLRGLSNLALRLSKEEQEKYFSRFKNLQRNP